MNDHLPPELLAAYVDGELTPAECRRVESWLAEHPEAQTDVDTQRRLLRFVEETAPPSPGEEQWADALAQIERELGAPSRRRLMRVRWAALAVAGLAAAAALVWLTLSLKDSAPREGTHDTAPQVAEEEWQVVSPDEIEIISMDDRDRETLVVGKPPVNEPMQLLMPDEVKVDKLPGWRDRTGRLFAEPGAPVIVSLDADPDEDR